MEAKHLLSKRTVHVNMGVFYVIAAALFIILNLLVCYQIAHVRTVLLLGAFVAFLLLAIYIVIAVVDRKRSIATSTIFLVLLVFQGMLYMAVFLPMTVPDEIYHFFQSYLYSNALMFVPSDPGSVAMRGSDATFLEVISTTLSGEYYPKVAEEFSFFADDNALSSTTLFSSDRFDMGSNPPQAKILSALGITIGRVLGLGAVPVYYLGRLFNFAGFVALAYFAVRFTPVGKRIFMVASCLPMTLHVTASYSYDACTIGLAFLFTVLCLRGIYSKSKMTTKLKVAIIVFAVLLAPNKALYSVLTLLVFLIPQSRFKSKGESWAFKFGVLLLACAAVLLMRLPTLLDLTGVAGGGSEPFEKGGQTGVLYTLSDILSDPFGFASMFLRTLNQMGDWWIGTLVGRSLAWFQFSAPWYVALSFLLVLLLAIPRPVESDVDITSVQKAVFVCVFAIGAFLVILSMYFAFTFNTEAVIDGVQGRYFLPLLPVLLLVFRNGVIVTNKDYSRALLYTMAVLNVAYVVRIYVMALAGGV